MKTLESFPEYAAAAATLVEAKAKHAAAVADRDALLNALNGAASKSETLAEQAQRLLAGDDSAVADLGGLRERYAKACRQVSLLGEVFRLAEQQAGEALSKASASICESARPEFAKLVLSELKAARALLVAQDARRTYWQSLSDSGVLMGAMPQTAGLVKGDLRDPTALFWLRVKDAVELGYIEPEALGTPPEAKPERLGAGKHVAAGPGGIREVHVDSAGTVKPGAMLYKNAPKAA